MLVGLVPVELSQVDQRYVCARVHTAASARGLCSLCVWLLLLILGHILCAWSLHANSTLLLLLIYWRCINKHGCADDTDHLVYAATEHATRQRSRPVDRQHGS